MVLLEVSLFLFLTVLRKINLFTPLPSTTPTIFQLEFSIKVIECVVLVIVGLVFKLTL